MRYLIVLLLVVASLAFVYVKLRPTEERQIERNLEKLLTTLNKDKPESLPVSSAIVQKASVILLPTFQLIYHQPEPVMIDKPTLNGLLVQIRQQVDRIRVQRQGHEWVLREPDTYWMDVTLEADLERQGTRETLLESYRLIWRKDDGAMWRLEQAEPLHVIRHPQSFRVSS